MITMSNSSDKQKKDSFFGLHFTSIVSISLVLFMIGIISMILTSARQLSIDTKENIALSIILHDSIQQEDLQRLQNYVDAAYFTKEYKYISKEDALAEHCSAVGEDPSNLLGFNPLNASIEVFLKSEYANNDSIKLLVNPKLSTFSGVNDISFQEDLIDMFNYNLHKASILFGIITIILLFISIVLINNTIRLTIYSKRFIINTMLLVGAKKSFIRAPFVRRSMINGFISALIAIALLAAGTYYTQSQIGSSFALYQLDIIVPTVTSVILIGLMITFFAARFSVNKYINMKTNKLYFV